MWFHRSVINENAFGRCKIKLGHAHPMLRMQLKQLEWIISGDRSPMLSIVFCMKICVFNRDKINSGDYDL